MTNVRTYGVAPFTVAVIHGGPGAAGEMAPVARVLANNQGVLEPLQTATSLHGQIQELRVNLEEHATPPVTLVGFSWGAWLSFMLAALNVTLVKKLILVGSAPFEETYVTRLQQTRLERLSEKEREEFNSLLEALKDGAVEDKTAVLARVRSLTSKTDAYDPDEEDESDSITARADVYQSVWEEAAQLRRSGHLMALGKRIQCPVVAIHGDHDPHPADGVRNPLCGVLKNFRFVLLERCGHFPWMERHGREPFYRKLRAELVSTVIEQTLRFSGKCINPT